MAALAYEEYFYLRKVDEVAGRAQTGDYYDLIMASGLLRHLLLEGAPLVHKANRYHKLKLRFTIAKRLGPFPLDPGKIVFLQQALAPLEGMLTEIVDEHEFLNMHAVTVGDQSLSVRDVLETCAYAYGGVHLRKHTEKDLALAALQSWTVSDQQAIVGILRQIIAVVLAGLRPLTEAVVAKANSGDEPPASGASGEL